MDPLGKVKMLSTNYGPVNENYGTSNSFPFRLFQCPTGNQDDDDDSDQGILDAQAQKSSASRRSAPSNARSPKNSKPMNYKP